MIKNPKSRKSQKNNFVFDVEEIQRKVANIIKKPLETLEDLEVFFKSWWCRHYNKPYKSQELQEYTLEELIYEYFDVFYRENPKELDKFLNKDPDDDYAQMTPEEIEKEDEEWLKKQAGDDYIPLKEQEKLLTPHKDMLDDAVRQKKDSDSFKMNFEDDELTHPDEM